MSGRCQSAPSQLPGLRDLHDGVAVINRPRKRARELHAQLLGQLEEDPETTGRSSCPPLEPLTPGISRLHSDTVLV